MRAVLFGLALASLVSCRDGGPASPASPDPASGPVSTTAVEETPETTFYVSPKGSDVADGRSPATALRTVQRAVELAGGGARVTLLPGAYVEEVAIESRDFGEHPLVLAGEPGAVLDGERRLAIGLQVVDSRGLVVRDLELRNFTDMGINVAFSTSVVLRNLRVHGNGFRSRDPELEGEGFGVNVDGSNDVVIEENEVFANGPFPEIRAAGVFGTGINTYGNNDAVIRRNEVHHNVGGGILVEDSARIVVEENDVYANDLDNSAFQYWDGGLWLDGGSDVVVRGNRFHENLGPGILVSDEEGQRPTGYVLDSNESRENYFGIFIFGFGVCPFPGADVLRLVDNDFSGNSRLDVWCEER